MPLLALTANASDDDRAACLEAGMDELLVKPLDREKVEAIAAAVKRGDLSACGLNGRPPNCHKSVGRSWCRDLREQR